VRLFSGICQATIFGAAGAGFGAGLLTVKSSGQQAKELRLSVAIHNAFTSSASLVTVSRISCRQDARGALECISRGFAENNAAKQAADRIEMLIMLAKNIFGPIKNKTPPKLGPIAVPTARGVEIHPFARP
jgi:hypothetical protein